MKQLLLLFLIVPFALSARREDPRIPKTAPYDGVKTMEVSYVFVIKSGNDTGMSEMFNYNEHGYLTNYDYDMHLMKNPNYHYSDTYTYQSKDEWTRMTYKNKVMTDSVVVRGNWANWYNYYGGKFHELHEYRGDSAREKVVREGDTIVRPNRVANPALDPFWDYRYAEKFASKTTARSVDSDTTRYFNAAGKCLAMIVNFYDSNFKPVKTDYYNFKVRKFELFTLPYSDRLDMIFFLNKSKKGHWSYEITRKYNEKGWLIEEYLTDAHPNRGHNGTPMIKQYKYTLY